MKKKDIPLDVSRMKFLLETSLSFRVILDEVYGRCLACDYRKLEKRLIDIGLEAELVAFKAKVASRGRASRYTDEEMFSEKSVACGSVVKKRLINLSLKTYICEECNLTPYWNNKKLNLQLDHKNGNSSDNRLDNLRFLCPNCHSQTETFAGKNRN